MLGERLEDVCADGRRDKFEQLLVLAQDRVYDFDAWSAHLSFRRYLPEPLILCASSPRR